MRESAVLGPALAAEALGCCGLWVISLLHIPPKERPGDIPGWKGAPTEGAFSSLSRGPRTSRDMRLRLLICLATLAISSFSMQRGVETTSEISIVYKVLEVFPKGCRVLITCHLPHVPLPITYSLWGSGDTEVAKKTIKTQDPASFSINVTRKSRPDLLTYFCQAATTGGMSVVSTKLQMYWELWANPVSQVQANFTLLDEGSGPRVEVSCQAFGSPPITYSLIGKNGHVYMQQKPTYGQPANFSFPLTETSDWLQCQAENDISVQSSPLTLVPPGQLPRGPAFMLAGSLTSIAAITSGMLGWTKWTRL